MPSILRFISRLPARLVLSFVALVLLAALAVGLPAVWLIEGQLETQARALVSQGSSSTRAILVDLQDDIQELALLTAQRPTLAALMQSRDLPALQAYLARLQTGAELDAVLVCDPQDRAYAGAGAGLPADACAAPADGFLALGQDGERRLWLAAGQPIPPEAPRWGRVVVAWFVDDALAQEMRRKTGVELILLQDGKLAASSLQDLAGRADLAALAGAPALSIQDAPQAGGLEYAGQPYYTERFSLTGGGLQGIVALPVTAIVEARQQVTSLALRGILGVTVIGSILGVLLAQFISRPLTQLGQRATALKKGDLETPILVDPTVPEIGSVASALEDARVALHHTLEELRQEKAWTDHLLESIVEGILTLDQYGRITYFSHGAERITGWTQDEVLGKSIDQVFPALEGEKLFSQFLPAPGRQQKASLTLRSGKQVTLAMSGARLSPPEAGKARVALVLRDVTDEDAMQRLLGDFLANIAHEFRTPLAAQAASIELLQDQLPDLSPDELQELLKSVRLGVFSLQTLIDNLLEGASIETGRFRVAPQAAELPRIIAEAVDTMQPLMEKYGQRLTVDLPASLPLVHADARRTYQVLVNLLSNATKYAPQDGEIRLAAAVEHNRVRVSVADQGPGIPEEHLPHLFRRFVRLEAGGERAEHGAGLGLSVVKAIVEAQGGQVGVANRPEGGAVFWFTLPRQPEGGPAA
jgi:PAS domain S-box-containing protein